MNEPGAGMGRGELLQDAWERLHRIAEHHRLNTDEHGGNTGECAECGWQWPCPTQQWANAEPGSVSANCPWDLRDCEFDGHAGHEGATQPWLEPKHSA